MVHTVPVVVDDLESGDRAETLALPDPKNAAELPVRAPDDASDTSGDEPTVQEVPRHDTTLDRFQQRSLVSSVRRLVDLGDTPAGPSSGPKLLRLSPRRRTGALRFPDRSTCVTVDDRGRIKVTWAPVDSSDGRRSAPIGQRLGWVDGALDVVLVDGWAVLTQPTDVSTRASKRYSTLAHYSSALGRIQLRPAHRDVLDVEPGMPLLAAPVFARNALIVVSPDAALSPTAPPEHVIELCLPEHLAEASLAS